MARFALFFILGFVALICQPIQAASEFVYTVPQNNDKGPAYTTPPKDDVDYTLMGEFIGTIKSVDQKTQLLGLQVRPIGNDSFDAVAYFGGLPGQKRHQPEPIHMIGKRWENYVVLSGGPWAIFVEKDTCQLFDRQGNNAGKLKRIRRRSPTLHSAPPEGATVLFNGNDTEQFVTARMTAGGLLMEGADVKPMFQDFNLHLEFRLPYMPQADDQQRSNSGLYLQSRYECQVLDSFAQIPKFNGLGSLYRFRKPDLNMCFPPLVWQSYDVHFTAPRWAADGTKIRDAHVTSWVNGVKVQGNIGLPGPTGNGKPEEPFLLPIRFQDHGDPVRFRNIWIVDRGLATGEFPVVPTKAEIQAAVKSEQQKKKARAKAARQKANAEKKAAAAAAKKERAASEAAAEKESIGENPATEPKVEPKQQAEKKKPGEKKPAKPKTDEPKSDKSNTDEPDADEPKSDKQKARPKADSDVGKTSTGT